MSEKSKYYIRERHNPQLGIYYIPEGQKSRADVIKIENNNMYGYCLMIPYETEADFYDAIRHLKLAGESVYPSKYDRISTPQTAKRMRYLGFDNEKYEKGFKKFELTRVNIKANIGKRICYVTRRDIDGIRYVFLRFAVIHSLYRNAIWIDGGRDSVPLKSIIECGIEISNPSTPKPPEE